MKRFYIFRNSTLFFLILILSLFTTNIIAQNIVVTDDDGYTAHPSAMLDVKSSTKGLLIPRITSDDRETLGITAETGLLVFDIEESVFYYFDGTNWVNISKGQVWTVNSNYVLLTDSTSRVGIGTYTPNSKLEVKADASFTDTDTLFAVKDKNGNIVFAVFPDGAKVYVNETAKGKVGGFAISGRSPTKATEEDYFKVTPDSTRVWVNESLSKGKVGGFAISGRSPVKGITKEYFISTQDSTRIYIDTTTLAKGKVGGFAISGRSPTKGITANFLEVSRDSTRVYVDGDGGFSAGDISSGKSENFMDLTPENYFIGHQSGQKTTPDIPSLGYGKYNSFMGYQSGLSNTSGLGNVFLGYQSGYGNTTGQYNSFMGYGSGFTNTSGHYNVFVGYNSGFSNTEGDRNVFLGYETGYSNTSGNNNVFLGYNSGYANSTGDENTFIGFQSGASNTDGTYNLFVGAGSGLRNTTGENNMFIGPYAGQYNISGSSNVYIGPGAGNYNTSGNDNIFIGRYSGYTNTTGFYNLFMGTSTGSANTTGSRNIFLGEQTGWKNTTGYNNVYLGYQSGHEGITNARNVFLGCYAGYFETGNGKLYIESSDADSANALIYGDFYDNLLAFNADVGIGYSNPQYKLHVVDNTTNDDAPAIYGDHTETAGYGIGVQGNGLWRGVYGYSASTSSDNYGVYGWAGILFGSSTGYKYGVYGIAFGGTDSWAGYFQGDVHVNGTLSKNAGSFKIDHPMDPENKYLSHSFVESPDMKNIYDGVTILDNNGTRIINLPEYFEALNKDFRYQLTAIGVPGPSLYISKEISEGTFEIAGGDPGMKVSWQVTGIRKDPYAEKYRIKVEEVKIKEEKGMYLNPELYGKGMEKGLHTEKGKNYKLKK